MYSTVHFVTIICHLLRWQTLYSPILFFIPLANNFIISFFGNDCICFYSPIYPTQYALSRYFFEDLFDYIDKKNAHHFSDNAQRIIGLKQEYINTIDSVILFLQGKNPTLVHSICQKGFLPQASRFDQLETYYGKAFGSMNTQDEAKHLATLYIEDMSDLIKECVDPFFGFSRYAERLARSANSFDEMYTLLHQDYSYIDKLLINVLRRKIESIQPKIVAISVPFPGNVFSAFRSSQWIKQYHPDITIVMGGGFPNTELRSVSDPRVFEFVDFITLDDGELPVECLVKYITGSSHLNQQS